MSDKKQVKNISGKTQAVVGIGIVEPDGVISVNQYFHNVNFKEVKKEKEVKKGETKKTFNSDNKEQ